MVALTKVGRKLHKRKVLREDFSPQNRLTISNVELPEDKVNGCGRVKGVKLLGWTSKNSNRRYLPKGVRAELYEGVPVNVNHPKEDEKKLPRPYESRFGWIENPYIESDGVYGDLCFNPNHPIVDSFVWWAKHKPDKIGLSQNAYGDVWESATDELVETVDKVTSIDLVSDPATTNGLFEAIMPDQSTDAIPFMEAEAGATAKDPATLTKVAKQLSARADKNNTAEDHDKAYDAHEIAYSAHRDVANKARQEGQRDLAKSHGQQLGYHNDMMTKHMEGMFDAPDAEEYADKGLAGLKEAGIEPPARNPKNLTVRTNPPDDDPYYGDGPDYGDEEDEKEHQRQKDAHEMRKEMFSEGEGDKVGVFQQGYEAGWKHGEQGGDGYVHKDVPVPKEISAQDAAHFANRKKAGYPHKVGYAPSPSTAYRNGFQSGHGAQTNGDPHMYRDPVEAEDVVMADRIKKAPDVFSEGEGDSVDADDRTKDAKAASALANKSNEPNAHEDAYRQHALALNAHSHAKDDAESEPMIRHHANMEQFHSKQMLHHANKLEYVPNPFAKKETVRESFPIDGQKRGPITVADDQQSKTGRVIKTKKKTQEGESAMPGMKDPMDKSKGFDEEVVNPEGAGLSNLKGGAMCEADGEDDAAPGVTGPGDMSVEDSDVPVDGESVGGLDLSPETMSALEKILGAKLPVKETIKRVVAVLKAHLMEISEGVDPSQVPTAKKLLRESFVRDLPYVRTLMGALDTYETKERLQRKQTKAKQLLEAARLPEELITDHFMGTLTRCKTEKEMQDVIDDRRKVFAASTKYSRRPRSAGGDDLLLEGEIPTPDNKKKTPEEIEAARKAKQEEFEREALGV